MKLERFYRRFGIVLVALFSSVLLLPEPARGVAIFPASSKGGGQCFAFPDACHVPLLPTPVPLPSLGIMTAEKKTKNKVVIQQKKTTTKKPSTTEVNEANAWLTRIERSAKAYQTMLQTAAVPKSQKLAALAVINAVLKLVAEGRAATKNPKTAGEMYTKLFALHDKLMAISYPTLLRQPLPLKKK
jgi:hypothetical protein